MTVVVVTCDRCKNQITGMQLEGATAGFYRFGEHSPWERYRKQDGESIVCDACMFLDPDYQRDYHRPTEEPTS